MYEMPERSVDDFLLQHDGWCEPLKLGLRWRLRRTATIITALQFESRGLVLDDAQAQATNKVPQLNTQGAVMTNSNQTAQLPGNGTPAHVSSSVSDPSSSGPVPLDERLAVVDRIIRDALQQKSPTVAGLQICGAELLDTAFKLKNAMKSIEETCAGPADLKDLLSFAATQSLISRQADRTFQLSYELDNE
jgi:hypothetical protein